MKRLLFLLLLLSSVTYGQRLVGSKATPGASVLYQVLLASDVPSNFLRSNATNTLAGDLVIDGVSTHGVDFTNVPQFSFGDGAGNTFSMNGGFSYISTGLVEIQTSDIVSFSADGDFGISSTAGNTVIQANAGNIQMTGPDGLINTWTSQSTGSVFRSTLSGSATNIGFEWLNKGTAFYHFRGNSSQSTRIQGDEDTDSGADTGTIIWPQSLTSDRTWTFPDATGTISLTSDLSAYQPLAANLTTLSTNGTAGYKVQMNSGGTAIEYAPQLTNPATTDQDLLVFNGTSFDRIPVGANGEVLTVTAGVVDWAAGGGSVTPAALTKTDDTNVTLTLGGTPATALLQATSITAGWTGTLAVSRGGTGSGTQNFVDISTNQTGLAGNKAWTGNHSYSSSGADQFIQSRTSDFTTVDRMQSVRNNTSTEIFSLTSAGFPQWNLYSTVPSLLGVVMFDTPGGAGPAMRFQNLLTSPTSRYNFGLNNTGNYFYLANNTITSTLFSVGMGQATTPTATFQIRGRGTSTGQGFLIEDSGGTDKFSFLDNGNYLVDKTITAGATTGNQTINKIAGTVNFAAAATTLTVTNSLVSANSLVFCTVRTDDTTATIKNVVPGAGSFVITLGAAATAETSVGFYIVN